MNGQNGVNEIGNSEYLSGGNTIKTGYITRWHFCAFCDDLLKKYRATSLPRNHL